MGYLNVTLVAQAWVPGGREPCLSGRQTLVGFLQLNLGVGTDFCMATSEHTPKAAVGVTVPHVATF